MKMNLPNSSPPSADDVSVFAVTDSKTKESHVFILAEISDYKVRNENELHYKYYRDGMKEMLTFRLWKVREDGTCTKEEFGYKGGRTDLQTFLVQYAGHPVGRYTDLLFAWPSFIFPILYPYATGLIGLILIFFGVRTKPSLH